jgi:hypothetical protein
MFQSGKWQLERADHRLQLPGQEPHSDVNGSRSARAPTNPISRWAKHLRPFALSQFSRCAFWLVNMLADGKIFNRPRRLRVGP